MYVPSAIMENKLLLSFEVKETHILPPKSTRHRNNTREKLLLMRTRKHVQDSNCYNNKSKAKQNKTEPAQMLWTGEWIYNSPSGILYSKNELSPTASMQVDLGNTKLSEKSQVAEGCSSLKVFFKLKEKQN